MKEKKEQDNKFQYNRRTRNKEQGTGEQDNRSKMNQATSYKVTGVQGTGE